MTVTSQLCLPIGEVKYTCDYVLRSEVSLLVSGPSIYRTRYKLTRRKAKLCDYTSLVDKRQKVFLRGKMVGRKVQGEM